MMSDELEIPVGKVDGPEMDYVSRPEVGQLRQRLFIEHGRRLPNHADNSSHGPQSRTASRDGRHRDSSPGPVYTPFKEFGVDWPFTGVAAKVHTDQG